MSTLATEAGLWSLAERLYPICRSITGNGLRQTLAMLCECVPLQVTEVPSGTAVFDWEVPDEWNIESAHILDPDGRPVVDFADHNLHIVNYSEPVSATMPLDQLKSRLHVDHRNAQWIPYRTSYYQRSWGFCLPERDLHNLRAGSYRVEINSRLQAGSLSYGELVLPGSSSKEVLIFTHACHPTLANDNVSGMVVAAALAQWLQGRSRRYTWRFVFAPGTIGSLCWLRNNEARLDRVAHGLVLGLLGDSAPWTYKRSRRVSAIDAIVPQVLRELNPLSRVMDFEPYGYDERQLCSPGFDLPVGRLTRSVNDGYAQYHSSADDLSLISPAALAESLAACQAIAVALEGSPRYVNLMPKGEPRLGKRGLYGPVGGMSPGEAQRAMLWVLNQCDGDRSLLDIAQRSGMSFESICAAARTLEQAGLLAQDPPRITAP